MNSLSLLLRTIPTWATVAERQPTATLVTATPPLEGGRRPKTYMLELRPSKHGGVSVFEQGDNKLLPTFCLERHINPDGSFCVFYGSEEKIPDTDSAELWWSHLARFLDFQMFAEKNRLWPLRSGLTHAEAADEQIAMENLAAPLGWEDEILEGVFRHRGWLAENLPRVSKDMRRVLNSRTPCPRGCRWKHKLLRKQSCTETNCNSGCNRLHKPILRAECPNRQSIEKIVLHEHRRKWIEGQIVKDLHQKGRKCCGTMKNCPLRDFDNQT